MRQAGATGNGWWPRAIVLVPTKPVALVQVWFWAARSRHLAPA